MWVAAICFWHAEGRTPRNEALKDAVVKQARATRHPWMASCDAKHESGKCQEKSVVSKQAYVRQGTRRRRPNLQGQALEWRDGREDA